MSYVPGGANVRVQFTIDPTGSVARSAVLSTDLPDPDVAQCVAAVVATWTFVRAAGGGNVVITYPFVFSPE
ncbi:MAG: AgmX/PglI C-terminal domain-containing protein [Myxococcota bacterium]